MSLYTILGLLGVPVAAVAIVIWFVNFVVATAGVQ